MGAGASPVTPPPMTTAGWLALSAPSLMLTVDMLLLLRVTAAVMPARVPALPKFTTGLLVPPLIVSGLLAAWTLTVSAPLPVFSVVPVNNESPGVLETLYVLDPLPPRIV